MKDIIKWHIHSMYDVLIKKKEKEETQRNSLLHDV